MKVEITNEEWERLALCWIREHADYKKVLSTLFEYGVCSSKFDWTDALKFAVKVCGKNFCSNKEWILKELK